MSTTTDDVLAGMPADASAFDKVTAALEWARAAGVPPGAYSRPSLMRLLARPSGYFPVIRDETRNQYAPVMGERVEALWVGAALRATLPLVFTETRLLNCLQVLDDTEHTRSVNNPWHVSQVRSDLAALHTELDARLVFTAYDEAGQMFNEVDTLGALLDLDVHENQWLVASRLHRVRCRLADMHRWHTWNNDADMLVFDLLGACIGPGWLLRQDHVTDTARSLAQHIYTARDFAAMPILADALQDGGCDSNPLLHELRDETSVWCRGCRVLDEILVYRQPLVRQV